MSKIMKIRLAMREEGEFWNAYLAMQDTMKGSKLIGSICIGAVKKNLEVKVAFQAVMQQALADAIKDLTGKLPLEWEIEKAPEAERAGHS